MKKKGLNAHALGMALGLAWVLGVLVLWMMASVFGFWTSGVAMLGDFYVGFDLTFTGLMFGLVWGLVDGYVGGWVIGWLYNKFAS